MKPKPTHQSIRAPYADVVAWRLDRTQPNPAWCTNIIRVGDHWEVQSKKGKTVVAQDGDWAVNAGESMVILTHEEFADLFRSLPQSK